MVYVEGRRPGYDWSVNEIRGFLAEVTKAHEGIGAAVAAAEERPAARLRAKVSPARAAAGGVRAFLPTAVACGAAAAGAGAGSAPNGAEMWRCADVSFGTELDAPGPRRVCGDRGLVAAYVCSRRQRLGDRRSHLVGG